MAAGPYAARRIPAELAWAVPVAAVPAHFFVVLSAHRAEAAVSALSADSSSHDLEKAFALALRKTLDAAPRIVAERPHESADLDESFKLWDGRLERASPRPKRRFFFTPIRARPGQWGPFLWPRFERTCFAGRGSRKLSTPLSTSVFPTFPPTLRAALSDLPEATYPTLRFSVRKEELGRAWIAWTQRFQEEHTGC